MAQRKSHTTKFKKRVALDAIKDQHIYLNPLMTAVNFTRVSKSGCTAITTETTRGSAESDLFEVPKRRLNFN